MSKPKEIETIEVGQIFEIFKKLEEDAKKQAELLTSIREKISCLDLKHKIPVAKPWGTCKEGWPWLNGKCSK